MNKIKAEEIIRDFEIKFEEVGAFRAIEYAVRELKKPLLTINLCDLSDFLLCETNKTAVYTGLCNHSSKPCNKNWYDRNDIYARGKSVDTTIKAIRNFFRNYEDYTLAFSIGTQFHEGCVFVQKVNGTYNLIHFNPTFKCPITIFSELVKKLETKNYVFGYQERKNNVSAQCSYFAWKEIIELLADKNHPFDEEYTLIYYKGPGAFVYNIENRKPTKGE